MIPANRDWVAVFNDDHGRHSHSKPVIAWDAEGAALVLDEKRGALRPARDMANFDRVTETDDLSTVAAIPGGGWQFEYTDDDGSTFRAPVVAWAIDTQGWAHPISADQQGGYGMPGQSSNFHRLMEPDEAERGETP
jgi:hypothetical protein